MSGAEIDILIKPASEKLFFEQCQPLVNITSVRLRNE